MLIDSHGRKFATTPRERFVERCQMTAVFCLCWPLICACRLACWYQWSWSSKPSKGPCGWGETPRDRTKKRWAQEKAVRRARRNGGATELGRIVPLPPAPFFTMELITAFPGSDRLPTLPVMLDVINKQKIADQTDSILLSRLPAEIRLLIYEYAVTGNVIHIEIFDSGRQVCATHCEQPENPFSQNHRCRKNSLRLLSLPLTCKQIFYESIDILYQNTFAFASHRDIIELQPSIGLQPPDVMKHFDAIQSLQFECSMGYGFRFDPIWMIFSKMGGLRHLRVVFYFYSAPDHPLSWYQFQASYLQPLKEAGIRAKVEIVFPVAYVRLPDLGSNFRVTVQAESTLLFLPTLSQDNDVFGGWKRVP